MLGLGDSNVLVKEMLPLVSMDDMLAVKKNSDDLVPAFGTKTSAAWFSSGRYPGDRGVVKPFKTLRGQVMMSHHPVVGVPVCLSVCACVVQCLVAVVYLFHHIRSCVCVCARARTIVVLILLHVNSSVNRMVFPRALSVSVSRFGQRLYADMTFS